MQYEVQIYFLILATSTFELSTSSSIFCRQKEGLGNGDPPARVNAQQQD